MRGRRRLRSAAAWLLAAGCASSPPADPSAEPPPPAGATPLVLGTDTPGVDLGRGPDLENSGIVASRRHEGVFWMHNDSGDEPRIYPVRRDGSVVPSTRRQTGTGVLLGGAINVDWEDIAVDASGHVIIADVGNNPNARRDLVLYYLDEPIPAAARSSVKKKVFFRYPDQRDWPAPPDDFNYDAEGVFTVGDVVYVLSKNRSDTFTKLYRLDAAEPFETNTLTFLERFDVGGKAVGADATPDGRRLVVVTYDAIWLFENEDLEGGFFDERIYWRPYRAEQVEAVCFADEETLLLADEATGRLYEVPIAQLVRIR